MASAHEAKAAYVTFIQCIVIEEIATFLFEIPNVSQILSPYKPFHIRRTLEVHTFNCREHCCKALRSQQILRLVNRHSH